MTTRSYFTLGAALALASAACSSSSVADVADSGSHKDVEVHTDAASDSGDRKDAGVHLDAQPDTHKVEDAGVDAPQPVFSADAGTTWTALYRDYFGNDTGMKTAGCSNGSFCHGSTSEDGYNASNYYLCPKGNAKACYDSITSQDAGGPQLIIADAGWENDPLSQVLCTVDDAGNPLGQGNMPYNCAYSFTPTDIARIKAWVAAGYPYP